MSNAEMVGPIGARGNPSFAPEKSTAAATTSTFPKDQPSAINIASIPTVVKHYLNLGTKKHIKDLYLIFGG